MIVEECLGGINYKTSDDFQKGILPGMARSILANNDGAACIVAMRGRNPDNPSDRTVGAKTEQRLEPNSQGVCNTLTSVQKDNLVLEQQGISTKGKKQDVASTLLAGYERSNMSGFNADNAVMETVRIKQATKNGYIECEIGGVADLSFPNSTTRRGRVQDGGKVSPTLMAGESDIYRIEKADFVIGGLQEHQTPRTDGISPSLTAAMGMGGGQTPLINEPTYRIRKLTPKECWRLMGFTDKDFEKAEKVNSNSQLYKQAGNSIVKNVLMAIFGQMIEGKENIYKEI